MCFQDVSIVTLVFIRPKLDGIIGLKSPSKDIFVASVWRNDILTDAGVTEWMMLL
jgi:hypothetical protein